jgi:hypothetical protein
MKNKRTGLSGPEIVKRIWGHRLSNWNCWLEKGNCDRSGI